MRTILLLIGVAYCLSLSETVFAATAQIVHVTSYISGQAYSLGEPVISNGIIAFWGPTPGGSTSPNIFVYDL